MTTVNDSENSYQHPDLVEQIYEFKVTKGQNPVRVDHFLTQQIFGASRNKIQLAINENRVTINGKVVKASKKINSGDLVVCKIVKFPPVKLIPEDIPLNIIYEDDHLLVVNKPYGMCTHPGVGNRNKTLVNALLWHLGHRENIDVELEDEEESEEITYLSEKVRPGIVHRIDKDTTGLLVVSKTDEAMQKLQSQFVDRSISREYHCLIWGKMKEEEGTITGDIGRSPRDRKKFAVLKKGGKHAITDYSTIHEYPIASYLKVKLRTGRTHQIRVHFSHNGHPLIGDQTYGGSELIYGKGSRLKRDAGIKALSLINRQMLHAKKLSFIHPHTGENVSYESELPSDFLAVQNVLKVLEENFYYQLKV